MILGKRELSAALLAAAGLVFYIVLLTTATSQAQIGGGVTNSTVINDNDQDNDQDNDTIDCDQILDIANEGHHDNTVSQDLAYGRVRGGRGGDVTIGGSTVNGSVTGGSGGNASLSQDQDVDFGDQVISARQVQNCINGDVNINGDDDDDNGNGDNGDVDVNVDDEVDDENIDFLEGQDGVVLDTSNLQTLPNTGISYRLSRALTAGLPGGALTVAFIVLGTGLIGSMSAWRFFGSRRGRSGD